MAKKKATNGKKSNKSSEVRQLLLKKPTLSVAEIAKAAKVTPALVYNVRSSMKKPKTGRSTTKVTASKKRSSRKAASNGRDRDASLSNVLSAARFVKECGGVDAALAAVKAVDAVVNAMN